MKNLADGVGDLKRVLTNVKDRGTWGEYQLEAILQATLTPDQYARNVRPTGSGEVVEFAVKLPGSEQDLEKPVWLPMDSKFPKEDYERLLLAVEKADSEGVKSATTALIRSLKNSAKDIHDKYISPPHTTDFAILFLPTEGLYAEVLRQPGLLEDLQKNWQILVAGPTILAALLNSLRVGFRTLAIEKRSHEVWRLLGKVKSEFGKFGDVLTKVKKQLDAASNSIDQTQTRTRAIQRNLQNVEDIPLDSTADLFLPGVGETIEADGEGKSAIEED
jgi:DNA recombination protein RmuC